MYSLSPTHATTSPAIQVNEGTTWRCHPQEAKYNLCAVEANSQNTLDLCHKPIQLPNHVHGIRTARRDPFATTSVCTNHKDFQKQLMMSSNHKQRAL